MHGSDDFNSLQLDSGSTGSTGRHKITIEY